MADTQLERILQYVKGRLEEAGKPDGLLVERQRSLPLDESLLPAAVIYLLKEPVQKLAGRSSVTRREAAFRVELRVQEAASGDTQLETLRQWVVSQLMADFSCGGLVKEIEELGSQWDQTVKDIAVSAVGIDFKVTYYTKVNDLTNGS